MLEVDLYLIRPMVEMSDFKHLTRPNHFCWLSLDSEFGVPIMWTPGVKKTLTTGNEKPRHSSREKNPITRFGYNEYMAHHYAFTMKVAAEQELESPSLNHMLEVEKRPNCAKAANRAGRTSVQSRPKKAKSRTDADEAEESQTGYWTPHT